MTQRPVTIVELGFNEASPPKNVLNAGCGSFAPEKLHAFFRTSAWKEIRLDIEARTKPDILGSITDLKAISNASFDAIWCSHNIEHLQTYEVPKALNEFRRVLKPDGFALITTPDLEEIAELVVAGRLEDVLYQSPAGPIKPLDMLFGLSTAIEHGELFMAHNTGFTVDRLGRLLTESGFFEAFVTKGKMYDIWALALMPNASRGTLLNELRSKNLDFLPES